jgi:hypothetical protein
MTKAHGPTIGSQTLHSLCTGLVVLGLCAARYVHAGTPPVTPIPATLARPIASAAPSLDGNFAITITLNASLSGLDPGVVSGAWLCSARAMSKPAVDAAIAKINALSGQAASAEFGSDLEYRAHYLGQQATAPFQVAGGGADASQTITIKVARTDLVDVTTTRLIDQPAVMVGCWLRLTNSAGQTAVAYQVAAPTANASPATAMAQVTSRPYLLAGASISGD